MKATQLTLVVYVLIILCGCGSRQEKKLVGIWEVKGIDQAAIADKEEVSPLAFAMAESMLKGAVLNLRKDGGCTVWEEEGGWSVSNGYIILSLPREAITVNYGTNVLNSPASTNYEILPYSFIDSETLLLDTLRLKKIHK